MDMVCLNCGEPWDMYYVLHEEPEGFRRNGASIFSCPTCKGKKKEKTPEEEERLEKLNLLAMMSGDDVDGFCAEAEDFGLV